MRTSRALGLVSSLALLAATPFVAAPAHAGVILSQGQTFGSDAAGWTSSTSTSGLCVPQLLCPAVTSSYVASDGSGGSADGYLRSSFSSLANTTAGRTDAVWESPAFAYQGAYGAQPTTVAVDLSRRARLSATVPVDLDNASTYRVDLVDQATGGAVAVVGATPLGTDPGWTALPTAAVDPALLTIGRDYRLRITTSYSSLATVTPSGDVGYDDVRLTATRVSENVLPPVIIYPQPDPTPTPTPAPEQPGIKSTRELRQLVRTVGLPSSAKLTGQRVKLRVTCPAQASPKSCKYAVQGLRDGKGSPATTSRVTKTVQPGQTRTVNLRVRPAYASKYAKGSKITIRAKVRVGVFKVTVVKKLTVR